jgi:predicted metal-dependent RNase
MAICHDLLLLGFQPTYSTIVINAQHHYRSTGGRVLHHLKRCAADAKNAILFAGFQAAGTRSAAMVSKPSFVTCFARRK